MIIAEIAQAHDGSLGMAHAYIDAVARCGVDAVKFQTHLADAESSPQEPWRVKFRAPSFVALEATATCMTDALIADLIAIVGSLDSVMGEVDR